MDLIPVSREWSSIRQGREELPTRLALLMRSHGPIGACLGGDCKARAEWAQTLFAVGTTFIYFEVRAPAASVYDHHAVVTCWVAFRSQAKTSGAVTA